MNRERVRYTILVTLVGAVLLASCSEQNIATLIKTFYDPNDKILTFDGAVRHEIFDDSILNEDVYEKLNIPQKRIDFMKDRTWKVLREKKFERRDRDTEDIPPLGYTNEIVFGNGTTEVNFFFNETREKISRVISSDTGLRFSGKQLIGVTQENLFPIFGFHTKSKVATMYYWFDTTKICYSVDIKNGIVVSFEIVYGRR